MEQEGGTLILFICLLIILGLFLVLLFVIFIKRKNALLKSKIEDEQHFKQEIIKTQIEIREETLKNISWELHDNIGQLMTLAKIQAQNAKHNPEKISEVARIIGDGLTELRALSKAINPETIKNLKLEEAIFIEIERFNRLNFIEANFKVSKERYSIDAMSSVVLFRVLQEFFSNTIKHSQATVLEVSLKYYYNKLIITASDNGVGFTELKTSSGIGLTNMSSRAKLIGADFKIVSNPETGTLLTLEYYLK